VHPPGEGVARRLVHDTGTSDCGDCDNERHLEHRIKNDTCRASAATTLVEHGMRDLLWTRQLSWMIRLDCWAPTSVEGENTCMRGTTRNHAAETDKSGANVSRCIRREQNINDGAELHNPTSANSVYTLHCHNDTRSLGICGQVATVATQKNALDNEASKCTDTRECDTDKLVASTTRN
jgi:hypothetical protein